MQYILAQTWIHSYLELFDLNAIVARYILHGLITERSALDFTSGLAGRGV